ncbi:alpha-1-antiproteinase [Anolis carolinensis]|uniref:alpha-1-antiproteinase n=1 Tax=Anolis carolinensis TaxID=28377 RepID=UPI002F2B6D53
MSDFSLWLIFAGLLAFGSCGDIEQKPPKTSPSLKISPSNADFAFKFYHQLASEAANKNIIFSPVSISFAFALLSLGAKGNTLSQLLTGLSFNPKEITEQEIHNGFRHLLLALNRTQAELELNIGNALFTHNEFKLLQKFLKDPKHFYQSEILPTNFKKLKEAEQQINNYIEKKTNGKLKDVAKNLDPSVVLVIVNYVFLKAYWEKPFNYEFTREGDFFVDEQTTVKVPMMNRDSYFNAYYDKDLGCQVVRLPYKANASALLILPDPGKLKPVEDALGKKVLLKWEKSLKPQKIHLTLPRFSLDGSYDVEKTLRKLGINDVFTNHANLTGISGDRNLKVSKAIHKAYLNVHENGTEAAAVTVIEVCLYSASKHIKCDRPFIFLICDEWNKSILFMGRLKNPSKK